MERAVQVSRPPQVTRSNSHGGAIGGGENPRSHDGNNAFFVTTL